MAVANDATANSGNLTAGASPVTWTHTVGTLTNGALYVRIGGYSSNNTNPAAVTYNGVALTQIAAATPNTGLDHAVVWRLLNPAAGAHTVSVTLNGGTTWDGLMDSQSVQGVDQTTPEGTAATTTQSSNVGTGTVSPAGGVTGDMAIDVISSDGAVTSLTMVAHGSRAQVSNGGPSGEKMASSYMPDPANPQVMDWTFGSIHPYVMAAIVIKQASGAAPAPVQPPMRTLTGAGI